MAEVPKKCVPKQLEAHILPFNWHVERVWALSCPVIDTPFVKWQHLLDLPLWSSRMGQGLLFDISPRSVLADPQLAPHHFTRIERADTDYPIDTLVYGDQEWILDGVHRLAKLSGQGCNQIRVRRHPQTIVGQIQCM